jgi:hypothetical protein
VTVGRRRDCPIEDLAAFGLEHALLGLHRVGLVAEHGIVAGCSRLWLCATSHPASPGEWAI